MRGLGALVLAAAIAGGVVGAVQRDGDGSSGGVLGAEATRRVQETLRNGGFERSLSGWRAPRGRASIVDGGRAGARAALVRSSRRAGTAVLVTTAKVDVTADELQATVAVRVRRGSRLVCLTLRSGDATARRCARASRRWGDVPWVRVKPGDAVRAELRVESRGEFLVDRARLLQSIPPPQQREEQTFTPPPAAPPPAAEPPFRTLPPGSALPSGDECARRVRRTAEVRPGNFTPNQTPGTRMTTVVGEPYYPMWRDAALSRVDGRFTGTTDEILQWAACKWGFDEDIVRAQAAEESWWNQSAVGDAGASFGILQVKVTVHTGTWPYARDSTAFNADYTLAYRRACFEGWFAGWLPPAARGDEWGCVGLWFSGQWLDESALAYIERVRKFLDARAWRSF